MSRSFVAICCECRHRQRVDSRDLINARPPHCSQCGGPLEFTRDSRRRIGSVKKRIAPNQDLDSDALYSWFKQSVGSDWQPPDDDAELSSPLKADDLFDQSLREAIDYLANGDARHVSPVAGFRLVELDIAELGEDGFLLLTAHGERCLQRLLKGDEIPELVCDTNDAKD